MRSYKKIINKEQAILISTSTIYNKNKFLNVTIEGIIQNNTDNARKEVTVITSNKIFRKKITWDIMYQRLSSIIYTNNKY